MFDLPTFVIPLIFAVIAAVAARLLVGKVGDDAGSFPGWILYAVAIGCVIISIALYFLGQARP